MNKIPVASNQDALTKLRNNLLTQVSPLEAAFLRALPVAVMDARLHCKLGAERVLQAGREAGFDAGVSFGYELGREDGLEEGFTIGYDRGLAEGEDGSAELAGLEDLIMRLQGGLGQMARAPRSYPTFTYLDGRGVVSCQSLFESLGSDELAIQRTVTWKARRLAEVDFRQASPQQRADAEFLRAALFLYKVIGRTPNDLCETGQTIHAMATDVIRRYEESMQGAR